MGAAHCCDHSMHSYDTRLPCSKQTCCIAVTGYLFFAFDAYSPFVHFLFSKNGFANKPARTTFSEKLPVTTIQNKIE